MEKIRITKEELHHPGPFLKGIMELAFDESCIMDKDGYILHCSSSSPLIWNRPNEESIGMHISELDSASPYPQLLQTGEAVLGKVHIINGMSCITHMIPLFDEHDEIIGAFGVIIFRGTEKLKRLMRDNILDLDKKSKALYNQLSRAEAHYALSDFIGQSPDIKELLQFANKVAKYDYPVLICGETGCGKEIISSGIHTARHQAEKVPFVKINCTAIPSALLESELFGYEKGAFSGAYSTKLGKFEVAGNGTLLLDEIGSLDPVLQSKLLRVIEEKEFERVGGNTLIPLRARIIACTNSNLQQKIQDGAFRSDLYYRLSIAEINIPPLRKRRDDIPLLVNHFITCDQLNMAFTPEAMQAMKEYEWPGNVRQLRNFISKLGLLEQKQVTEADVSRILGLSKSPDISLKGQKDGLERQLIEQALTENHMNISQTAKALGMSRNTLYLHIRKLGIQVKKQLGA